MPACPLPLKETWVESNLNSYSTDGTEERVRQIINSAINFRNSRNVKVFCGEFGVYIPNSSNPDRTHWYKTVRQYLEMNNIPWTTWDYKGGFGLFNKGSNELFGHDLNVQLLDSLGLNPLPQTPFVQKPDSSGFMIYDDYAENGILGGGYGTGSLDFFYKNLPEAGNYCIDWSGFSQYNALSFDLAPDRDLSKLVTSGYALDLMVRGSAPGIKFEIRFRDSKTGAADHPWRMAATIDGSSAQWDLRWHHLYIPLTSFLETGAWDNGTWYNQQGIFDWTNVDLLEISTEWTDILGKRVWFDNINITDRDTAIVRVNETVGITDLYSYGSLIISSYPNPMTDHSVITFSSPDESHVRLSIFSTTGATIRTLADSNPGAGHVSVIWDGRTDDGSEAAAGIYICRLQTRSAAGFCRIIKF
jgi:endoglucanase